MEIIYPFARRRKEFGRHCAFTFCGPDLLFEGKPNPARQQKYIQTTIVSEGVQNVHEMSEHEVNPERIESASRGMLHLEGGWPKDIDPTEPDHLNMFRKKVERDENFLLQLLGRTKDTTTILNQNLSLDIYQKYFDDYLEDTSTDPASAIITAVLRDPYASSNRWARCVSFHPDERSKIAVAYSVLKFQKTSIDMPMVSHVWDINNPNYPVFDLTPLSSLCCLEYNLKDSHTLVGGCYNGLISLWDLRKGNSPYDSSLIEKAHKDPVYKVQWLQSKTGAECASISSDGTVKWWDIRKISEPLEEMEILNKGNNLAKMGGTAMDYDPALGPSKFMVGTEEGIVLSCNKKSKTPAEKVSTPFVGHIGPVYAVQRNPVHSRFFLSVGDWTAKLWMDDLRVPILSTPFDSTYMSAGCWSPAKPSQFYTAKNNGMVDVWDMMTQGKILSLQVTESADIGLACLELHPTGKIMATGATDGTVYIHELSDSLCTLQPTEKSDLLAVLEREAKREKNVDARIKEQRLKERQSGGGRTDSASGGRVMTPLTPSSGGGGMGGAAAEGEGAGLGLMGAQTVAAIGGPPATPASAKQKKREVSEEPEPENVDEKELDDIEKEFYEMLGLEVEGKEEEPQETEEKEEPPQETQEEPEAQEAQEEQQPEQPQEEPEGGEEDDKTPSFLRKVVRKVDEKTSIGLEDKLDDKLTKHEEKLEEQKST
ncbi:dynein intermediate chain IC70 [Monocercomonoides exilis]|uniref:dynein intermediate chain IC70 n=1 Tax=Monocercomonoides exilis TaxID=2049356 RepID=UPI00355AAC94|nr:dynein intermediate chain IC70 [Monocercomonoides exilis]|eukprot:MONOS_10324.1-p1 / transcript=MONOS_10324.1 / gene=MONOS_10324 / organism=Monocercomonoides_exilis_PA203 / gene_product=dynein intermediate chain IC70 / transcript_product=dynein intermediate chain IC70 / location=Mono_scaffold00464:36828-39520(+) / protein_length=709 / sequence_SO=supercontig / SO=protein_coding / is_pseudo=false